jgi:hypothetical protein
MSERRRTRLTLPLVLAGMFASAVSSYSTWRLLRSDAGLATRGVVNLLFFMPIFLLACQLVDRSME